MKTTINVLLMFPFLIFAQDITIKGRVTTLETSEGLSGVTIQVKGKPMRYVSDINGYYSLEASSFDTLIFLHVGYSTQEIPIGNQTTINVNLVANVQELSEVVVVGYGTLERSDLTGAVTTVKGEELQSIPLVDPLQGLVGKVSGLQIQNSSGEPGSAPIIRLRGVTTLNNNNPLIVIDGVAISVADKSSGSALDFINPNDIASMEVLKDASATSIFGARGSNGVIIITTKQGTKGKVVTNVNFEQSWESIDKYIDVMNGKQFAEYVNELNPGTYNNLDVLPNINWQKRIYQSNVPITNFNLSVNGGSDKIRFYNSFGYYSQQGIMPKSKLERITGKINLDYEINEKLNVGLNLSVAYYNKQKPPDVVLSSLWSWPINEPYKSDGSLAEVQGAGNPLANIEYSNNKENRLKAIGNFFVEYEIIEGLKAKTSFQTDVEFMKSTRYTPAFFVAPLQQNLTSDINKKFSNDFFWLIENTLSYNKKFGFHKINAVVGYTAQNSTSEDIEGHTENLLQPTEEFRYLDGGDLNPNNTNVSNGGEHFSLLSTLFRLNYTIKNKYLFSVTGRRDASSNFGKNNRSAFFPSFALGWNIYKENFFIKSDILDKLKLRGSWGVIGNEKIDYLKQYSTFAQGYNAVFNDALVPGVAFSSAGNESLKWEETTQWNIGLEFTMFSGHLSGEVDYYNKTTDGILVELVPPGYLGLGGSEIKQTYNAAGVENIGLEFNLSWEGEIGDFSYSLGVNGSTIKNTVLDLGEDVGADSVIIAGGLGNGQNVTRTTVGESIGNYYGYKVIGVFQNKEQLKNTPHLVAQNVGDLIYQDANNDGVINHEDRVDLGSSIPNFIYGFNLSASYKGISIIANLQGQTGNKIYNGKQTVQYALLNYETKFLNRWNGEGTSNEHFKASSGGINFIPSDYFLEDGSYFRLRTLTLSYDLPSNIINKANINGLKIYIRGTNLFTQTNFTGYTPDIGSAQPVDGIIDMGRYPSTKIYSIGINITF